MARRKQFQAISHDILRTFASRYNDLDGYWALGQYVGFLESLNERKIEFDLGRGTVVPNNADFIVSARYYRAAIISDDGGEWDAPDVVRRRGHTVLRHRFNGSFV